VNAVEARAMLETAVRRITSTRQEDDQISRARVESLAISILWAACYFTSAIGAIVVFDVPAWALGLAVVGGAALLASLVPARRAATADPMESLRGD
jgi:ABC-type lipoprotein release transport system permease subunit